MGRAGTLDFSSVEIGVSAQEIVDIALDNVGTTWTGSPAGFAWGVSNLAGLPFFDLRDFTDGPANTFVDVDYYINGYKYESPHWWNYDASHDGWETVWHKDGRGAYWNDAEVADLKAVLKPGDIVRVYDYGNHSEHSEPDCDDVNSHTFIVVSTAGGKIEVVDTWGDGTVVRHDWSDIVAEMTRYGEFQSAYVSRVKDDALHGDEATTLKGNGYGDWSGIGYDLTIGSAPTIKVEGPAAALELSFSYRIGNIGTLPVAASKTGIYLSTDATITTSDTLLTVDDVAALLAGGASTETGKVPLPSGLAAGTYYIGIIADHTKAVSELSETNNTSAATAVIIGPDFKVATAPTLSWNAGALDFSYRIDNIGTTAAPASKTGIYLSTDATITTSDTLLTADDVAALLAGGNSTETGKIALPSGLAAGTYYIGVIADHTKAVSELSETNNTSAATAVIIGADLKVATAPTLTWNAGALDFSYRIDNIGTTVAPASKTGIYLSTDATITTSDTLLAADDVAALLAGVSSTETGKIALPSGLAAGTYYIGVIADHTKAVSELSETNNTSAATAVIIGPDFKVATAPTLSWNAGALDFSYRIDNIGTTVAPASKTGIYLSTDSTITTADTLLAADDVAALLAGGSSTETGKLNLPAGLAAGTYYIGVIADHTKAVSELSETNNTSAATAVVIGADLKVATAPTLSWNAGALDFSYRIDNIGTTAAPASKTGIYLSTDSIITTADTLLAADDVAALLAGGNSTETGKLNLPAGLAAGTYYIGVIADHTKALGELSETNNTSAATAVIIGPDLKVATAPTLSWNAGALDFSYRIDNIGTTAAPASKTGIYLSTDATITTADTLLAADDVAALLAAGNSTETGKLTLPSGLAAGTYYVGVIADHTKAVGELSETNNTSAGRAIALGADLDVIAKPALKIVWAGAGGTFNLTYTIDNLGTTTEAPATSTGIYLSTNRTITAADRLVAVDDVASLLSGASRAEGGTFTLPSDIAGGNYYIGVIADHDNALAELDEGNNPSPAIRITVFTDGADTIKVPSSLKSWHGLGGDDTMTGTSKRDALYGDEGKDSLIGGRGNDTLIGGAGADVLTGGQGADFFQFDSVDDIGRRAGRRDIITDWDPSADYIDLRKIDARTGVGGNNKFSFVETAGSTFSGRQGELHWIQQDRAGTAHDRTIVMGDVDGDKTADFTLEISGLHTMRAVDFLL